MYNILRSVIVIVLFLPGIVTGQEFTKIKPMRSTCQEIMNILKVEGCKDSLEFYTSEEAKIEISYSSKTCETAFGKKWNVMPWTALSVTVYPLRKITLSEIANSFDVDLNSCTKQSSVEKGIVSNERKLTIHTCKQKGVSFWSYNKILSTVILTPTPDDYSLVCEENNRSKCKEKFGD